MDRYPGASALLVAAIAVVASCGHPYTSVYLVNLDAVPYCISVIEGSGPGDRTESRVGAGAAGVLFSTSGEITGVARLMALDGTVLDQVEFTPGRPNLVEISGGRLRLDDQADLSDRGAGAFPASTACSAA